MMTLPESPIKISHISERCNSYPGEKLVFYTQFSVDRPVGKLNLRISLPEGLTYIESLMVTKDAATNLTPGIITDEGHQYILWKIPDDLILGTAYEIQTITSIDPTQTDRYISSGALIMTPDSAWRDEESTTVVIRAKSKYIRYLPEIFAEDEFLGRFLSLFESFWQPIEDQIKQMHYNFDPGTTPTQMIPWLNSWVGIEEYDYMPLSSQRDLLRSAVTLMRKRGTKEALVEYLKIFTGGDVRIVEHRGSDFRLGPTTYLGPGIALGKGNLPHTFTVYIRDPKNVFAEKQPDQDDQTFADFNRAIRSVIESLKPAHTNFALRIER